MFGVVLWSDTQAQSAVIWCEDHGDLAFYKTCERSEDKPFDAGDWVQFDVTLDCGQRLALNPRLVAEGLYTDRADKLSAATQEPGPKQRRREIVTPSSRRSAEVIPFGRAAAHRKDVAAAQTRHSGP